MGLGEGTPLLQGVVLHMGHHRGMIILTQAMVVVLLGDITIVIVGMQVVVVVWVGMVGV